MTDITLNGRLKAHPYVNVEKLAYMKDLYEGTVQGDKRKSLDLVETMTTSDGPLNFAHLVNLNNLADYDEAPRTWSQIATTRGVSDFRDVVFYSLSREWEGGVLGDGDPRHVSPIVPEGVAYPYAHLAGETYAGNRLVKRGFKVGLSWEMFINDPTGYVRALPDEIRNVALDTEEYEVYNALISGVGAAQKIAAATNPDGTTVVADNPLTRAALIAAIAQLGQREINGRKVVITGGYNLIVAPGQRANAEFQINNMLLLDTKVGTNPAQTFGNAGYNPLSGITVIESEYVTGAAWYLLPKPGQRRPVLELGRLIGQEAPELRVANFTGTALTGNSVGPFSGSFDNDSIDFRVRQVVKGLIWTKELVVWSDGTP